MTTPKLPFFIINSGRPFYTVIDMSKNEEFAKILKTPKSQLPDVPRNCMQNAYLHQKPDMLIDYLYDDKGRERKKFREEVVIARADAQGRILIPAEQVQLARKSLADVRVLDPSIELDTLGAMLPEELPPEAQKAPNKGGRPRRSMGLGPADPY